MGNRESCKKNFDILKIKVLIVNEILKLLISFADTSNHEMTRSVKFQDL